MNKLRLSLILIMSLFTACASADAADTSGFHDTFQYLSQNRWHKSDGWANGDYQSCEWRADAISLNHEGMQLQLSDRGGKARPIGCPEIHTGARLGYGLYEARIRAAAGSGLDTGFFTYIGPPNGVAEWDEIDFEFLGKDPHTVNIGNYTNGKATHGKVVQLGYDASQDFHDYAFEWMPNKIRWYADGKLISETPDGTAIPHNPGMLFFNIWSGAKDKDNWMGPFKYNEPATAAVAWTAYTPPDAPCQFPESLRCKK